MVRATVRRPETAERQKVFSRLFFDENLDYDEARQLADKQVPYTDDPKEVQAMRTWYCNQKKKKAGTYKVPVLTPEQREKKRAYDRLPEVVQKKCVTNKRKRSENPEHVRQIERKSRENNPISRKLTNFICDLKRPDRPVIDCALSDDEITWHFTQPCDYCGALHNDTVDRLMGIDRVDNDVGFIHGNVVPCCFTCNVMKKTFAKTTFIQMALSVGSFRDPTFGTFPSVGHNGEYQSMSQKFEKYKTGASKRKNSVQFTLTEEQFESLCSRPCFYCGLIPDMMGSGIDRVDNDEGYTTDNCVASCTTCNFLKQKLNIGVFLDKCHQILVHQNRTEQ